jgi:fructose-bisphosphate aldolase class 1
MSLFDKLEEHAEHIFATFKRIANHEMQTIGAVNETTAEIVSMLDEHLTPAVEPEVVVEAVSEEPAVEAVVEDAPVKTLDEDASK